ncbi:LOW QUALITY PROTEIN: hypothetical protein J0S82_015505, partial [Galemys pyrenaicus]
MTWKQPSGEERRSRHKSSQLTITEGFRWELNFEKPKTIIYLLAEVKTLNWRSISPPSTKLTTARAGQGLPVGSVQGGEGSTPRPPVSLLHSRLHSVIFFRRIFEDFLRRIHPHLVLG